MSGTRLTRRLVLQASVFSAAGVVLAGCGPSDNFALDIETLSAFSYFRTDQAGLLLDVANIMIPQTETVGAADTQTILYLDQLMQQWAGQATKLEVTAFIESLNAVALDRYEKVYLLLSAAERQAFLHEIDAANFADSTEAVPVKAYRRIKWLIFHIHYSSAAANPDFVLIPGQYRGDVSQAEYFALVEENRT